MWVLTSGRWDDRQSSFFSLYHLAFSEGFLRYNYYTTKVTHLKHIILWVLVYSHSCQPSPPSNSRMFSSLGSVSYVCLWLNVPRQQSKVVRRQTPEPHCLPRIPAPPLASCVILEKLCGCSESVFSSVKWDNSSIYLIGLHVLLHGVS